MRDLVIKKEKKEFYTFPEINFNVDSGMCSIEGESFMENAKEFYKPVNEWLIEFNKENPKTKITLKIELSYYNTSSSKAIFELFYLLQKFQEKGADVEIYWFYNLDDKEMEEDIMDLQLETGIDINIQPK